MVEWQKTLRSINYKANGMIAEVWPYMTTKKVYSWSVIGDDGVYVDCGMAQTEDLACEDALRVLGV